MDSDAATSPLMPRNAPFGMEPAAPSEPARSKDVAMTADRDDPTGVFGHLVTEDRDIAGLVAYSIYKQNKLDWLRAFEATTGRKPDERELAAYIIGEGTPRRLATYRHLAEATLAGNGPEVAAGEGVPGRAMPATRPGAVATATAPAMIVAYGLIAVLFVALLWLSLHFTAAGH